MLFLYKREYHIRVSLSNSVTEADEVYNNLLTALGGLKLKGNKTELQNMVNKAAGILADREKYVEASLEGLNAANTKAVEVLNDENAVQSEINEALKGLISELLEACLLGFCDKSPDIEKKTVQINMNM